MSIALEISNFLGVFDVSEATIAQVEQLEDYIMQANRAADETAKTGKNVTLVEDAMYDVLVSKLREVKPDSPLLQELWEEGVEELDDLDTWLVSHPMKSILTVKDLNTSEYQSFLAQLDPTRKYNILFETKLNGHGIRLQYVDGTFVAAKSRARNSQGRDLTEVIRVVLANKDMLHIEDLEDTGLVELRCEMVVSLSDFEVAKGYVKDLVSPLFAVASMSRASATPEEHSLLSLVAYRIFIEDVNFDTRSEEFEYLQDLGFQVPLYLEAEGDIEELSGQGLLNMVSEVEEVIFDEEAPYEYYIDGLVMELNDMEDFHSVGGDLKYDYGNVALKVGAWEQNNYKGYVQFITWSQGKGKLSPVAIVAEEPDQVEFIYNEILYQGLPALMEDVDIADLQCDLVDLVNNYKTLGIPTANGSKVKRVPLYEPANLFILDVQPNSLLHFKYGGEAGVVPTDDKGRLLTALKGLDTDLDTF